MAEWKEWLFPREKQQVEAAERRKEKEAALIRRFMAVAKTRKSRGEMPKRKRRKDGGKDDG